MAVTQPSQKKAENADVLGRLLQQTWRCHVQHSRPCNVAWRCSTSGEVLSVAFSTWFKCAVHGNKANTAYTDRI